MHFFLFLENLLRDSAEGDSRLSWEHKTDRTSSVKFVEDENELLDKEEKEVRVIFVLKMH